MITGFLFDTLPGLWLRFLSLLSDSWCFGLLRRCWRWLRGICYGSFLGRCLARPKRQAYERSQVFAWLDRALAGLLSALHRLIARLTPALSASLTGGLCRQLRRRCPWLDFEFVCGVAMLFLFLCPGERWHNVYALVMGVALLALLLVLLAENRRPALSFRALGLPVLCFALASVVGVGIAANLGEAVRVFTFFVSAFILGLVVAVSVSDQEKLKKLLSFFYLAMLITAAVAFYQRVMGVEVDASLTDLELNEGMPGRVYSTFENPNNYAEYIVLLLPMALAYCTMLSRRKLRLGAILLLILPVGALLMTYSRSGWVSFALAVMVFVFFYDKRLLLPLLALCIMAIPLLPETIYNRILTIGTTADSSNMYRVYIWDSALQMLRHHGIAGLGLGPANFRAVYLAYAHAEALPAPHSHMLALEIWLEMGLLGILSFLAYYLSTLRNAIASFKAADKSVRIVLIAGVSALVGVAFQATAEYIWYYPRVMFSFFLLMGLLTASTNIARQKSSL